jgi:hypothetical protein
LTGSSKNPDPPGKGLVYLSAAPLAQPDVVRVPNVTNQDLYEVLGWPTTPPPWGWDSPPRQSYPAAVIEGQWRTVPASVAAPWEVDPERSEASPAPDPGTKTPAPEASQASTRRDQARRLLAEGTRPAEVVRVLWGLKTNTGRAADEAMAELTTWIAEWVGPDLAADNPPPEGV